MHHTPAVDKAHAGLQRHIERARALGESRLPSVRQLARGIGVSHVSILKALERLRAAGTVAVSQGRGIRLADSDPPGNSEAGAPPRRRRWQQLVTQLEHDILNGVYTEGTDLPSRKQLAIRYGVCHRTLHKALADLVNNRALVPHGKSLTVPLPSSGHPHGTVVLVARETTGPELEMLGSRTHDRLRTVESECARLGLNIEMFPFTYARGAAASGELLDDHVRTNVSGTVLGYLIWTLGINDTALQALLAHARHRDRPVALLDELGCVSLTPAQQHGGAVRVLPIATSARAGSNVCRYLLSLGHRHIAYISPFHRTQWSRNRLAGLRHTFARAGLPDAVRAYTLSRTKRINEFLAPDDPDRRALDLHLADLLHQTTRRTLARTLQAFRRTLTRNMEYEERREFLRPLLDNALSESATTAWVGCSDDVAIQCLDYLRDHDRAVPHDISVLGFDDTVEAFVNRLTSYNFNMPAITRAMIRHVLYPSNARGRHSRRSPTGIEGFISVRDSASRAGIAP